MCQKEPRDYSGRRNGGWPLYTKKVGTAIKKTIPSIAKVNPKNTTKAKQKGQSIENKLALLQNKFNS